VTQSSQSTGSPATEDYAKAIYKISRRSDGGRAGNSALAEALSVSPGAVTAMLRRMQEEGLIDYVRYEGASLTEEGKKVALEVLRHHRLLETYLAEELGMPWDRVHDEAEVLEHYISEELEELIAAALDDPERDPHGDPIPSRELELSDDAGVALGDAESGAKGVFVRVSDANPDMLRYLAGRGIRPGDSFEVLDRQPFGGPLTVRFGTRTHALSERLTAAMRIEIATADKAVS
jgi:DtxR family transcriptional regulator, Mn-dependent transcriptional regulator